MLQILYRGITSLDPVHISTVYTWNQVVVREHSTTFSLSRVGGWPRLSLGQRRHLSWRALQRSASLGAGWTASHTAVWSSNMQRTSSRCSGNWGVNSSSTITHTHTFFSLIHDLLWWGLTWMSAVCQNHTIPSHCNNSYSNLYFLRSVKYSEYTVYVKATTDRNNNHTQGGSEGCKAVKCSPQQSSLVNNYAELTADHNTHTHTHHRSSPLQEHIYWSCLPLLPNVSLPRLSDDSLSHQHTFATQNPCLSLHVLFTNLPEQPRLGAATTAVSPLDLDLCYVLLLLIHLHLC